MLLNVRLIICCCFCLLRLFAVVLFLFCFLKHDSFFVCMIKIFYVYIDTFFWGGGERGGVGVLYIKKPTNKNPSLLLSRMFEHDTCYFGCLICMYFCICTCSAQLSMFHMERRSRNTFIIITAIIVIIIIIVILAMPPAQKNKQNKSCVFDSDRPISKTVNKLWTYFHT